MNAMVLDPSLDPDQDHKPATHPTARRPMTTAPVFHWEMDAKGVVWLTFDTPGSPVNVFNEDTLLELDEHLSQIAADNDVRALVIESAKDQVFIAGADLKAIRTLPPARVEGLVRLGQSVFNRLAALPVPKVAMIHGACVGGGFELALACDARVASDADCTRLGLPETQLGLIPGWGGSTRLPRLIGPVKGIEMILSGRLVKATQAKKLGMVDVVAPRDHLREVAQHQVDRLMAAPAHPSLRRALQRGTWRVIMPVVAHKARLDLQARTRGLYAAPLKALEVIFQGYARSVPESLELEVKALLALTATRATGHLIDLFFAREAASKKPWPEGHALPVDRVAVIGAGVMGAGIAQWLASKGLHVTLTDVSAEAVGKGLQRVRDLTGEAAGRRLLTAREARDTLDRVQGTHERVSLRNCQLVIEAATEDIVLKKKIFADLAARCGPETILATNTSALSVRELAGTVPHPERVIGLHFFNPVHRMSLVEVIRLPDTHADVVATAHGLVQRIGKVPVVVNDSPGFVVNRVLVPYLMEAVSLFERGHDPVTLDDAMLDFGMPMGPMRLLDEIGLDVAAHVARTLGVSSQVLDDMVHAGWLGRKAGRGFYVHAGQRSAVNGQALALRAVGSAPLLSMADIEERLARMISSEAMLVLKEKVAQSASDVDLAMVLGTGYAPFRGGPLAYAACMEELRNE